MCSSNSEEIQKIYTTSVREKFEFAMKYTNISREQREGTQMLPEST